MSPQDTLPVGQDRPAEPAPSEAPPPENLAEELLDALAQVLEVLVAELPLLRAMRTAEIGRLAERKVRAASGYHALLQKLSGEPALAEGFSAEQRRSLRQAAQRVAAATTDNALALRAGLEANHRLVRVIASAVESQQQGGGYRSLGQARGGGFRQPPPAVSVNRVL